MTKKITLLLLMPVMIGLILSSCAGKFGVQKRRYNKGFYIAGSNSTKQKEHAVASHEKVKPLPQKKSALPVTTANKPEITVALPEPVKPMEVYKPATTKPAPAYGHKPLASASKKEAEAKPLLKKQLPAAKKEAKKKAKGNANTVLLIILSLFPILALIAIYLHDGSITLNFWIDLLLHFIFLYWLFAILVVVDAVDLS